MFPVNYLNSFFFNSTGYVKTFTRILYYCSLSSIVNFISLYMFVNLVHYSIFTLRKAKVCRNMYDTISFKSVLCFLNIITKFLLFRPFGNIIIIVIVRTVKRYYCNFLL